MTPTYKMSAKRARFVEIFGDDTWAAIREHFPAGRPFTTHEAAELLNEKLDTTHALLWNVALNEKEVLQRDREYWIIESLEGMTDEQLYAHVDTLLDEMRNRGIHHLSLFASRYIMVTDKPGQAIYADGRGMREAHERLLHMNSGEALLETMY